MFASSHIADDYTVYNFDPLYVLSLFIQLLCHNHVNTDHF